MDRTNPDLFAGTALVAHVDLGRRVFADQESRQPRCFPAVAKGHSELFAKALREGFSVDDLCTQRGTPFLVGIETAS